MTKEQVESILGPPGDYGPWVGSAKELGVGDDPIAVLDKGVAITVAHYPPGASKWNPTEHRLFSHISHNWQGEPLKDYDTMLNFIRNTTTETGLRCQAVLDSRKYPTKIKITAKHRQQIRLKKSKVLPQWNYTVLPQTKRPSQFCAAA